MDIMSNCQILQHFGFCCRSQGGRNIKNVCVCVLIRVHVGIHVYLIFFFFFFASLEKFKKGSLETETLYIYYVPLHSCKFSCLQLMQIIVRCIQLVSEYCEFVPGVR